MRRDKTKENDTPIPSIPPSATPEGRENRLISIAYDLAEKQILEGTASAMVLHHFLKLGSTRGRIEQQLLVEQTRLASSKAEAIESQKRVEELYAEAINAFRLYNGVNEEEEG